MEAPPPSGAAGPETEEAGPPEADWQAPPTFTTFSASYLYGRTFILGEPERDTVTFETVNAWRYGDNFLFVDVQSLLTSRGATTVYGEWAPRLSASKLFGRRVGVGPLTDVLFSAQLNFGASLLAHLSGLGLDFRLPAFQFFQLNGYLRDTVTISGVTWQATAAFLLPFGKDRWMFSLGGFTDVIGPEGGAAVQLLSQTQLLHDLGALFDSPGHVRWGIEMSVWLSKYGIPKQNEYVPQPMVRITF